MSLSRCVLCFFVLGIPGFPPPLPVGLDVWDHILALGRCELSFLRTVVVAGL